MRKVLIIRFSSLGDILQCFPAAQHLKAQGFDEVHWLTREDFQGVVQMNPFVDKCLPFPRRSGLLGLISLAFKLRRESYEVVYDAHNNLRSHILCLILRWGSKLLRRSKFRLKRYLLFRWRMNLFGDKVIGRQTYLSPLGGQSTDFPWDLKLRTENYVALVPGAAWPLKQWSLNHWRELIRAFPQENFVILGGKTDEICFSIAKLANPQQVRNLAGQLSYVESIQALAKAKAVISNDTGLLHAADLLKKPTVALIGPSAFGYPASVTSKVQEVHLWCKPCSKDGRGRCFNESFMKCMNDIRPEQVGQTLREFL